MHIQNTLEKLFQKHRVIFWYDENGELTDRFESCEIDAVEKIRLDHNEFAIKIKIMREQPDAKFLVYSDSAKPKDTENWLLDLNLAFYEFSADRASLICQELKLPPELKRVVLQHIAAFDAPNTLQTLTSFSSLPADEEDLRLSILASLINASPEFEDILFHLLQKIKNKEYEKLKSAQLNDYFWQRVQRQFGYNVDSPTPKDLVIQLLSNRFLSNLASPAPTLNKDATIFVNHWMDSASNKFSFIAWSELISREIDFKTQLDQYSAHDLARCDVFEAIDHKIILDLRDALLQNTLGSEEIFRILKTRETTFWYQSYRHTYAALSAATTLLQLENKVDLRITSMQQGFQLYRDSIYNFDLTYRHFIFACQNSMHHDVLQPLYERIENLYTNSYLPTLGVNWQQHVDACESWSIPGVMSQAQFFDRVVKPAISDTKVAVIFSDAFRYEAAVEFLDQVRQQDRFEAELDAMLGSLPSNTHVGMAAMLPHKTLSFTKDAQHIRVDDKNTSAAHRESQLKRYVPNSLAIKAEDLMRKHRDDGRELIKSIQLLYVYHNRIDSGAHDAKSEDQAFKVTSYAFDDLFKLLKKIANLNISRIYLTADHGYLYQHSQLHESDLLAVDAFKEILQFDRRFLVGQHFDEDRAFKKFTAAQLSLGGEHEFLFPKSVNRLRKQGGGTRFVHGGAMLQEIVIPLLTIRRKRESTVRYVDVEVIKGSSRITTNEVTIAFDQKEPISDYVLKRELKIGFYTQDNKLISDEVKLIFDATQPENRAREQKHKFVFKKEASQYSGQQIVLKRQERIPDTNTWRDVPPDEPFILNILIQNEFDDF